MYEKKAAANQSSEAEFMMEATKMLDRVKVMRVFDLAGVAEAVGEVRQLIDDEKISAEQVESQSRRRSEIGDSEDEDEEDVLVEIDAPPLKASLESKAKSSIGMVIIDTITNVVSAMVTRNYNQGQGLLASTMRSLSHLTARHQLCTILTNAAVGISSSKKSDYQRRPEEHVSVFASTLGKPALGKTFTYLIDTSIFLSIVPKTNADAMAAYGEQLGPGNWRNALVIEVLKDRCGDREGRWATFDIASNVKLVPC